MPICAQNKWGLKFGLGTYDILSDSISLPTQNTPEFLKLKEAKLGYFAGTVLQINKKGFIIQPEIFYHYNEVVYDYLTQGSTEGGIQLNERNHTISMLCLLGTKAGPLRLNIGPIAYWMFYNDSDLITQSGFSIREFPVQLGFQAGLGVDIWQLLLDLRYESYFQPFGSHLLFNQQHIQFNDTAKRLVASISFVF